MTSRFAILALLSSNALAWGPIPSWSVDPVHGVPTHTTVWNTVYTTVDCTTSTPTAAGTSKTSASPSASAAPSEPPTAVVLNGTYGGYYQPTYNQDYFLGIPYALPPVNELRYRVPQSLNTTWTGVRTADAYSAECVGYGTDQYGYATSEDCLYLNVIRPAANTTIDEKLPVALWIHGGGFFEGGAPDKRYNLSFIVENSVTIGKPMLAVSINYRLSGWGFLSSKEVSGSGQTNLGLRDQRLAMHWVQENIAAFGGDPEKVTIWGESAGALSVGLHLNAYNGRDDKLFRGAAMESGDPIYYEGFRYADYYEPLYQNITSAVGCANSSDTLECLRQTPFEDLNAVLNTTLLADAWNPVIDGDFIQRQTSLQLADGSFVHVPILLGANTDEGTAFSPSPVNSTAELIANLEEFTGLVPALVEQLIAAYPDDLCDEIPYELGCTVGPNGAAWRRSASIYGDLFFIANRRHTCATWAGAGLSAYCYRFNAIPAGLPQYVGVTHFQEVAFVFDNIEGLGYDFATPPFTNKSQSYIDLAKLMSNSWVSFFVDQDPNSFRAGETSIGQWPVYSTSDPQDFVFDANVTSYAEPDTFRAAGIAEVISLNTARGI